MIFIFQSLSLFAVEPSDRLFKKVKEKCDNTSGIIDSLKRIEKLSNYGLVDEQVKKLNSLLNSTCASGSNKSVPPLSDEIIRFITPLQKSGAKERFNQLIYSLSKASNKSKCDLSLGQVQEIDLIANKYQFNIPESLNSEVLKKIVEKDLNKASKNVGECLERYIWELGCGNYAAFGLHELLSIKKNRSIKNEATHFFGELDKSCHQPYEKKLIRLVA